MTTFIHIHAKCNSFEIFEQVPESKAATRLVNIRRNFEHAKVRNRDKFDDHLSVKTIVVNPELPFKF